MKIFHYKDSDYSGMRECTKISRKILDLIHKTTFFVRDFENYNNIPSHAHHYMGIHCKRPYPPPWNAFLVASAMLNGFCEITPTLPICVHSCDCSNADNMPTIDISEHMSVSEEEKSPFYEIVFSSNDEMFSWMAENMTCQVVDNRDVKIELERRSGKTGLYFNWRAFKVYGIH